MQLISKPPQHNLEAACNNSSNQPKLSEGNLKTFKLTGINHQTHKNLPTKPVRPSNYYKSNQLNQTNPIQITKIAKNQISKQQRGL